MDVIEAKSSTGFELGDRVKIGRDEKLHPSKGTWSRYRGRLGVVRVADNWGEVGVQFGEVHNNVWFKPHELTAC